MRGEVVLDTICQNLVGSVPPAAEEDTRDWVIGGHSASSRDLHVVLLHSNRTNLEIINDQKVISLRNTRLVPCDDVVEVVAVHEVVSRVSPSHHQSYCGLVVLQMEVRFELMMCGELTLMAHWRNM